MTRVSIITVSYNSAKTIADTLLAVSEQGHPDVEHIIVDGASTDDTMTIVKRGGAHVAKVISEPDRGIYDAMNKGLSLATGEVVAFLNSDDVYADASVLSDVVSALGYADADFAYGDLQMVDKFGRIVRDWRTGEISAHGLSGTQIPHPALFVRREWLLRITPAFDTSYRIAADLKQQLILINQLRARGAYVRRPLVKMRLGGTSTSSAQSYLDGWRESARAYNEVLGAGGAWYTAKKVMSKVKSLRLSP